MSTDVKDQAAIQGRLWDEIARHQIGMLGVADVTTHMQPMTAFPEQDRDQIWFFTRADTALARQIAEGHAGLFVFQQRELQACITGELTLQHDPTRIDKYWNAVVAAWYPEGKADPRLTMMCLDCHDAEVWVSEGGLAKFAWEIAKANATHRQPHIGAKTNIHFH